MKRNLSTLFSCIYSGKSCTCQSCGSPVSQSLGGWETIIFSSMFSHYQQLVPALFVGTFCFSKTGSSLIGWTKMSSQHSAPKFKMFSMFAQVLSTSMVAHTQWKDALPLHSMWSQHLGFLLVWGWTGLTYFWLLLQPPLTCSLSKANSLTHSFTVCSWYLRGLKKSEKIFNPII